MAERRFLGTQTVISGKTCFFKGSFGRDTWPHAVGNPIRFSGFRVGPKQILSSKYGRKQIFYLLRN